MWANLQFSQYTRFISSYMVVLFLTMKVYNCVFTLHVTKIINLLLLSWTVLTETIISCVNYVNSMYWRISILCTNCNINNFILYLLFKYYDRECSHCIHIYNNNLYMFIFLTKKYVFIYLCAIKVMYIFNKICTHFYVCVFHKSIYEYPFLISPPFCLKLYSWRQVSKGFWKQTERYSEGMWWG